MFSFSKTTVVTLRSTVLLLFGSILLHSAVVTVDPTVTSLGGGIYKYAYSIAYTGLDDAFLVDISVPKDPAAITNLSVPSGFKDQFDSVNGLVSFLEDSSMFTSTATSGFSFDSSDRPGTALFVASVFDSNFNIYTISGSTIAPEAAVTTPEPSYSYLFAFLVPACLIISRRKTGKNSKSPETIHRMELLNAANR